MYVVKSIVICFKSSYIWRRVPSLPLYCPLRSLSFCFMQQPRVHISRFGTLLATGCDKPENLDAKCLIVLGSPPACRGRISRSRIF